MKKIIATALVVGLLSGCAPGYTWKNLNELDDATLCQRAGYALADGDTDTVKEAVNEAKRRAALGITTINDQECKMNFDFGQIDKQTQQKRANAFSQSMAELNAQQQAQRPVTTNCNRFGNSVSCTTY